MFDDVFQEYELEAPEKNVEIQSEQSLEQLKKLYPEKPENEIIVLWNFLLTNSNFRLPLTKEMEEYIKIDEEEKRISRQKEQLKEQILNQYKSIGYPFEIINFGLYSRKELNDQAYYEWVSTITDNKILEELTIKSIDYELFNKKCTSGEIKYNIEDLPDNLAKIIPYYRITVERKKK